MLYRLKDTAAFSASQAQLLADLGAAQAGHESAGFTSNLCVNYNNCIGYTYVPTVYQVGRASDQPEEPGYNPYGAYRSIEDNAWELADYIARIKRRSQMAAVQSVEDYAQVLRNYGYFTAPLAVYINGMNRYLQHHEATGENPGFLQRFAGVLKLEWVSLAVLAVVALVISFVLAWLPRRIKGRL